jgi:hypothetical protein
MCIQLIIFCHCGEIVKDDIREYEGACGKITRSDRIVVSRKKCNHYERYFCHPFPHDNHQKPSF